MKIEMSQSVIKMRGLIKEATADCYRRKVSLRGKKRDFNLIRKIPAALVIFIFTGYISYKIYNVAEICHIQKIHYSEKKSAETISGLKIAETAISGKAGNNETVVMPLFSKNNPLLLERINALSGKLKTKGQNVNIYWAANEGEYNSEDEYSPFIDRALSLYPMSNTLVIVSAGDVSNAKITDKLENFINGGGLLVMAGEMNGKSPMMDIVKNGKAVLAAGTCNYKSLLKIR
ncbi:MAG: hypothetical protein WCS96_10350 [Victivallales bacterium]